MPEDQYTGAVTDDWGDAVTEIDSLTMRPTQNEEGTWDALDRAGYGYSLGLSTKKEVVAWLDGYETGARENM